MKLRWFDRLFLTLYTLVTIVVAACLLIVTWTGGSILGVGVDSGITGVTGQLCLSLLALFLLLAGVRYLFSGARRKAAQPVGITLKTTDCGAIRISVAALDALVLKSARRITAIRDVQSRIVVNPQDSISVGLKLSLMPDAKAPEVSEELQRTVKAYLEENAGVAVQDVQIFIEAPVSQPPARVE